MMMMIVGGGCERAVFSFLEKFQQSNDPSSLLLEWKGGRRRLKSFTASKTAKLLV
jgi:hypothetical protein